MPQRSLYMLIGAIVLGLLAVFVMRFYIGGERPVAVAAASAPRSTTVVVAATAIPAGARIAPAQLRLAEWPLASVPTGSFASLAALKPDSIAAIPLVAGEPLLASKLAGAASTGAGIVAKISPGMRAATVRVTDVTGTGGFILPGQRVDILVTRVATQAEPPATDMLAQDVRVIGVNQDANETKDKPEVAQSVTVEVTPVQSLKLALAQTVGTVSLILRNPDNKAAANVPTVRVADLKDRGSAVPRPVVFAAAAPHRHRARPVAREPVGTSIEVVRGSERATYRIARGD